MTPLLLATAFLSPSPLKLSLSIPESTMPLGISGGQANVYVTWHSTGTSPVNYWSPLCSWGYECLTFELQPPGGGPTQIVKRLQRDWDKNFPQWYSLAPGGSFTRPIAFGDGTWERFPVPLGQVRKYRVRAVFTTVAEPLTKEHSIWTGRSESDWITAEFRSHMPPTPPPLKR